MISEEHKIFTTDEVAQKYGINRTQMRHVLRFIGLRTRGAIYNIGEREMKILDEFYNKLNR